MSRKATSRKTINTVCMYWKPMRWEKKSGGTSVSEVTVVTRVAGIVGGVGRDRQLCIADNQLPEALDLGLAQRLDGGEDVRVSGLYLGHVLANALKSLVSIQRQGSGGGFIH